MERGRFCDVLSAALFDSTRAVRLEFKQMYRHTVAYEALLAMSTSVVNFGCWTL